MDALRGLGDEENGYLTTTGRRTGKPHTIEIWFAAAPDRPTLYMLAGGGDGADWVRNIRQQAAVTMRLGDRIFAGRGRVVTDSEEDRLARRVVVKKYYGRDEVQSEGWEAEALPIAIDIEA